MRLKDSLDPSMAILSLLLASLVLPAVLVSAQETTTEGLIDIFSSLEPTDIETFPTFTTTSRNVTITLSPEPTSTGPRYRNTTRLTKLPTFTGTFRGSTTTTFTTEIVTTTACTCAPGPDPTSIGYGDEKTKLCTSTRTLTVTLTLTKTCEGSCWDRPDYGYPEPTQEPTHSTKTCEGGCWDDPGYGYPEPTKEPPHHGDEEYDCEESDEYGGDEDSGHCYRYEGGCVNYEYDQDDKEDHNKGSGERDSSKQKERLQKDKVGYEHKGKNDDYKSKDNHHYDRIHKDGGGNNKEEGSYDNEETDQYGGYDNYNNEKGGHDRKEKKTSGDYLKQKSVHEYKDDESRERLGERSSEAYRQRNPPKDQTYEEHDASTYGEPKPKHKEENPSYEDNGPTYKDQEPKYEGEDLSYDDKYPGKPHQKERYGGIRKHDPSKDKPVPKAPNKHLKKTRRCTKKSATPKPSEHKSYGPTAKPTERGNCHDSCKSTTKRYCDGEGCGGPNPSPSAPLESKSTMMTTVLVTVTPLVTKIITHTTTSAHGSVISSTVKSTSTSSSSMPRFSGGAARLGREVHVAGEWGMFVVSMWVGLMAIGFGVGGVGF